MQTILCDAWCCTGCLLRASHMHFLCTYLRVQHTWAGIQAAAIILLSIAPTQWSFIQSLGLRWHQASVWAFFLELRALFSDLIRCKRFGNQNLLVSDAKDSAIKTYLWVSCSDKYWEVKKYSCIASCIICKSMQVCPAQSSTFFMSFGSRWLICCHCRVHLKGWLPVFGRFQKHFHSQVLHSGTWLSFDSVGSFEGRSRASCWPSPGGGTVWGLTESLTFWQPLPSLV